MIARPTTLAMLSMLVVSAAACGGGSAARAARTPAVDAATAATSAVPVSSPTLPPGVAPTPAVTPPPAASPGTTGLTFTGSMSGQATPTTSAGSCGRAPAAFAAELRFAVAGQPYALTIALLDYSGPGSYSIPPERVSVRSGQAPGGQLLPATRGSVTVDAGERSGRIDAVIGDGSTRVSGPWACS